MLNYLKIKNQPNYQLLNIESCYMKSPYHLVISALITSTAINAAPKRIPKNADERNNLNQYMHVSSAIAITAAGGCSPIIENRRNIPINPTTPVSSWTKSPQQRSAQSSLPLPTIEGFLPPNSPLTSAQKLEDQLPKFPTGSLTKQDQNEKN